MENSPGNANQPGWYRDDESGRMLHAMNTPQADAFAKMGWKPASDSEVKKHEAGRQTPRREAGQTEAVREDKTQPAKQEAKPATEKTANEQGKRG